MPSMRTDDFDYDLPAELIAQAPAEPRDSCRLLVLHRSDGRIENSSHSCLGYVRSDGRVENSSHSCLGYVEGVSREWAAAFFFFFF